MALITGGTNSTALDVLPSDPLFIELDRNNDSVIDFSPTGGMDGKDEPVPPFVDPEPPFQGLVNIDGNLDDWDTYLDGETGAVCIDGDEEDSYILGLCFIVDDQGLYLIMGADQFELSQEAWMVFLDVDGDASGSKTMQTASAFARNITFADGFSPDYGLFAWQQADPQLNLWEMTDDNQRNWINNVGHIGAGAVNNITDDNGVVEDAIYVYESFITWDKLFDGPLPAGAKIQVAAAHFEGDWTEPLSAVPNVVSDGGLLEGYYSFSVDSNNDGVADLDDPQLTLEGVVITTPTETSTETSTSTEVSNSTTTETSTSAAATNSTSLPTEIPSEVEGLPFNALYALLGLSLVSVIGLRRRS